MAKKIVLEGAAKAEHELLMNRLKQRQKRVVIKRGKRSLKEVLDSCEAISVYSKHIIGDLSKWKCSSYNHQVQAISLFRTAFFKYPMASFWNGVTELPLSSHLIYWAILVGQGGSLYKHLGGYLTKKEIHCFLNAPDGVKIGQAVWYGKAAAAGIKIPLALHFVSRVTVGMELNDPFWNSVLLFIGRHQNEINPNIMIDIMDYLRYEYGQNHNYSISKRTVNSILKAAAVWHNLAQGHSVSAETRWNPLPIRDGFYVKDDIQYNIKQLVVAFDLYSEGRIMSHCVGSYVKECMLGQCAIVSLAAKPKGSELSYVKKATIEVRPPIHNNMHRIVQCRGKCNKEVDKESFNIVRRWAIDNNMNWSLSRF